MAHFVGNLKDLPPDVILLDDGETMPLRQFYEEHGNDLRHYLTARILVVTPPCHVGDVAKLTISTVVGFGIDFAMKRVMPNSKIGAKIAGKLLNAAVTREFVGYLQKKLDHGQILRIYTIAELFPGAAQAAGAEPGAQYPGSELLVSGR